MSDDDGGTVRVAVRVRPFNEREKTMNSKVIIEMEENQTWITNPDNDEKSKPFAFDYSYWSHDGSVTDADGVTLPDGPNSKYASQRMVFDDLGQDVLQNAWKGYNCSLFAYGQTGSGKSYSMVGYGANKGIIPITCETLFSRVAEIQKSDSNKEFHVTVSMLEIYNEQVRDLLNPKVNPPGGLKLRQSPAGVFVDSLEPVPVLDYPDIESKMELGTKNRTVASTKMNATSSRAHTVFTIMFQQISKSDKREQVSKINLIDLAGSERADSTGATGDRLKEGCAINLSLTCLGNVISALADLSMGKKGVFVPYRNSVLTRLLQDALGGNSKTIMICALSPASVNYEETMSTLKYAERAKRIKNKAVVNENPTDKMIRELKEENDRLKAMLQSGGISVGGAAAGADPEARRVMDEQMRQLQAQIDSNQRMSDAMARSWEQKLKDAVAHAQLNAADEVSELVLSAKSEHALDTPHLLNLHDDALLSETIIYLLRAGLTRIGTRDAAEPQDIVLSGLSLQRQHCTVAHDEATGAVALTALEGARVFVNGRVLHAPCVLRHGDRVILGNNWAFRYRDPRPQADPPPFTVMDFAAVMLEMQTSMAPKALGAAGDTSESMDRETHALQSVFEQKLAAMQAELDRERRRAEAAESGGASSAASPSTALARDLTQQVEETKQLMAEQLRKRRQVRAIAQRLAAIAPDIVEANAMAAEMGKPVKFEAKLSVQKVRHGLGMAVGLAAAAAVGAGARADGEDASSSSLLAGKTVELVVRMNNLNDGNVVLWTAEKFESRLFMMRDLYREHVEQGFVEVAQADDPFWDPPEPVDIGTCFVYTRALTQLVEISKSFQICSRAILNQTEKNDAGQLEFSMFPLDEATDEQLDYLEEDDDPFKVLLNRRMKLHIEIGALSGLPERFAHNVFCGFTFLDAAYETRPAPGLNTQPRFADAPWTVPIGPLSAPLLSLLQDGCVQVDVKGYTAAAAKQLEDLERHEAERRRAVSAKLKADMLLENLLAGPGVATQQPRRASLTSAAVVAPASLPVPIAAAPAAAAATSSSTCQRCEEGPASLECRECAQLYCAACDALMHKAPSRAAHVRVPCSASGGSSSQSAVCDHCEENAASVNCAECAKKFCSVCANLMHKAPSRAAHVRVAL